MEPVSLNRLACLLIVLGLGLGHPGNFIQNMRRVSEHNVLHRVSEHNVLRHVSEHYVLLFIYVL